MVGRLGDSPEGFICNPPLPMNIVWQSEYCQLTSKLLHLSKYEDGMGHNKGHTIVDKKGGCWERKMVTKIAFPVHWLRVLNKEINYNILTIWIFLQNEIRKGHKGQIAWNQRQLNNRLTRWFCIHPCHLLPSFGKKMHVNFLWSFWDVKKNNFSCEYVLLTHAVFNRKKMCEWRKFLWNEIHRLHDRIKIILSCILE